MYILFVHASIMRRQVAAATSAAASAVMMMMTMVSLICADTLYTVCIRSTRVWIGHNRRITIAHHIILGTSVNLIVVIFMRRPQINII